MSAGYVLLQIPIIDITTQIYILTPCLNKLLSGRNAITASPNDEPFSNVSQLSRRNPTAAESPAWQDTHF